MTTITDKQKKNDDDLAQKFLAGDLDFIKDYSTASSENLKYALTNGFEHASYNGQLDVVKFLLTSNNLAKNADIHHSDDYALTLSAYNGHLDVVRYLLTSPKLKKHANIHARENSSLRWASQANQLSVIQYLLESPEIKEHADINLASSVTGSNAFMGACDQNSLDVVKYLAQKKALEIQKALYTLNIDKKDGFMLACENYEKDSEILDFIVFEMNFEPNAQHKKYFKENENNEQISYAEKIIKIRDLNLKLNCELGDKKIYKAKVKI